MSNSSSHPIGKEPSDPTGQRGGELSGTYVPSHRLTRRQILALPILATTPSRSQAARETGISESTLYRWLQDENFRDELGRLTAEAAERTRQELEDLTLQSVRVLRELMEDSDPMVRLRAARAVAAMGLRPTGADGRYPAQDQ